MEAPYFKKGGREVEGKKLLPPLETPLYKGFSAKKVEVEVKFRNFFWKKNGGTVLIILVPQLDLEVEAGTLDGVGTDLAVGNSHMVGMYSVTFEGFF